jgi:hypothetical protein
VPSKSEISPKGFFIRTCFRISRLSKIRATI